MKQLPFTVADQRQNFIGLPCKEDIRQEYLHLIVCIKLNDAKSSISLSFSHLYLNRGALITLSLLLKIYITQSLPHVLLNVKQQLNIFALQHSKQEISINIGSHQKIRKFTDNTNIRSSQKNEAGTKPPSQTKEGLEFEFFLKFQSFYFA